MAVAVVAHAERASASGDFDEMDRSMALARIVGGLVGGTVAMTGTAIAIVNGVRAGRRTRSSDGMVGWGLCLNLASAIAGTVWMLAWKGSDAVRFGVGVPVTANGAVGIGLTIWSDSIKESAAKRPNRMTLSVVPQLARDGGSAVYGAGLQLSGF